VRASRPNTAEGSYTAAARQPDSASERRGTLIEETKLFSSVLKKTARTKIKKNSAAVYYRVPRLLEAKG